MEDLERHTDVRDQAKKKARQLANPGAAEGLGKPLGGGLVHCRSTRVGEYRLAWRLCGETVEILGVVPRSEAYKVIRDRLA